MTVDPKEVALTHERFIGVTAPQLLPEARGASGEPRPEADELWDLVSLELLHSEHPVESAEEPAKGGGIGFLPILGGAAALLVLVLVFALRRR